MEYLIQLVGYWLSPLVTHLVVPIESRLMMAPVPAAIIPWLVTAAVHLCHHLSGQCHPRHPHLSGDPWSGSIVGIWGGIQLGVAAAIVAIIGSVVADHYPSLMSPFLAVSILPRATSVGRGFYTALGGLAGYWLCRPFIGLCR